MNKEELKNEVEEYLRIYMNIKNSYVLYKCVRENSLIYKDETSQITNFLVIALSDIFSMTIINVCKLLDIRNDKNIIKLINVCKQNIDLFCNSCIARSEALSKINELEININSLDAIIIKTKEYRDKYLAHFDKKYWKNVQMLFKEHKLSYEELDTVLNTISNTLNELLRMLCNTSWVIKEYGTGEYEYILNCIKEHLDK